jgi:hypothetical protein
MLVKNLNDTIGNRSRDVPGCSAVPQPTAPPRAPYVWIKSRLISPERVNGRWQLHVIAYIDVKCFVFCSQIVFMISYDLEETAIISVNIFNRYFLVMGFVNLLSRLDKHVFTFSEEAS